MLDLMFKRNRSLSSPVSSGGRVTVQIIRGTADHARLPNVRLIIFRSTFLLR